MLLKNRYPGISVVLFKNVGRQKLSGSGSTALAVSTRFSGQSSILDVTKYIGERGSVRVSKSVREPSGTFTIEFVDKLIPDDDDSLYGLFEPMDVVEIRMTANSWKYGGGPSISPAAAPALAPVPAQSSKFPIMMRGFISHVGRSQTMGSDGKPTRKVTISGKDYGKIWEIYHIYFNPWMADSGNYLTQFLLFTRFGVAFQPENAGAFITEIFNKILNPFIMNMGAKGAAAIGGASPLLPISMDIQTQGGSVSPFGTNTWSGGSAFALLQQYSDAGCWNELYIEDRESGPFCVYRPNPFLTAGGDPSNSADYIQNNATMPAVVSVDSTQIISFEVSRADTDVANYFWVEAPFYDMNYQFLAKALAVSGGAKNTFIITDYGNVDPTLYGFKRMAESTNQGSPLAIAAGNGLPKSQSIAEGGSALDWIGKKRGILYQQNKDNVVFEKGSTQILGNEAVKAGTYLRVRHGNMNSPYYVVAATHTFVPYGTYTTVATLERGGGFIDRAQRGSGTDSPYLSELADAQLS